ncbi:hypothetical protein [Trinickia sp.]|uniref:hypothetical protein n=1 Tax=Trinickia sp. TaxID=2571163 RepID=UPI003F804C9D
MKANIVAFAVVCIVAVSGCTVDRPVTASKRQAESAAMKDEAAVTSAEALLEQAIEEQRLKQLGVQPGTKKAEILLKWDRAIRNAPDLKARFAHGFPPPQSAAGQYLFADGLSRITPAQRAEFWSLYARVAAAHLPDNCYGESNPAAITSRLMTFANFTDDDADEYMGLSAAILHASVRHDPEHVPTSSEYQAATLALGRLMVTDIKDKADAGRFARIMVSPGSASVADKCWITRVSIRAIEKLPATEKEIALANSFHRAAMAAASKLPQPAAPAPTVAPAVAKQL